MTFSIAGRCGSTGQVGIAITTSSICVGSRCPWVRAGVGAVATQNVTLPSIGPAVLDLMASGLDPESALKQVMAGPVQAAYRQVTVIDTKGRTAHFSGEQTLGTNAVSAGEDCIAAGNILASGDVPAAMSRGFAEAKGEALAERLLRGLEAGQAAGGERGPVHSAALLIAHEQAWPLVDLRVDWDDHGPIEALRHLWQAYQPELQAYVTRALDPASAPAYGVPGDQ